MAFEATSRHVSALDDGLPTLPDRVRSGQPVPVAVWTGRRFGAVTAIEDCVHDPFCPTAEHYVAITYAYRRGPDGWEPSNGAGGTDWPGGTSTSASLDEREVLLEGGWSGPSDSWECLKVEGFAGRAARWVELSEGSETTRRPIAESGAFVVVLDGEGPATVRILDAAEDTVAKYEF
jgi:hypothetical protein